MRFLSSTIITFVSLFAATTFSFAALPEPVRTNRLEFDIPFSISADDTTTKNVELLFSFDGGRQWFLYGRVPVEAGTFAFRAPREGEFCFAFRMQLANGETRQTGPLVPQLRIVIDTAPPPPVPRETTSTTPRRRVTASASTQTPASDPLGGTPVAPPPKESTPKTLSPKTSSPPQPQTTLKPLPSADTPTPQDGPVTPPHKVVAQQTNRTQTDAQSASQSASPLVEGTSVKLPQLIPAAPDAIRWMPLEETAPAATELGLSDEAIAELIGDMQPRRHDGFSDGIAATTSSASTSPAAASPAPAVPPGRITAVALLSGDGRPRIAVRWSLHADPKISAAYRVDVLKGRTLDGPWRPLVINYDNSGEYWWHLSTDDFEPFFIAVRTHNTAGDEVALDKTATEIKLDPAMLDGGK
ncbi:MAG: hypothetical protein ACRC46_12740 [Thermoguttaceae bacterium]